jgi:hypothetical protein
VHLIYRAGSALATETHNRFERHPIATVLGVLSVFLLCATIALECILRLMFGLGNPVLYDSSPIYGYRPLPNQSMKRFHGSEIRINNLGLRADVEWDNKREKKILFLGDSVTYGGSYISNSELFSTLAVRGLDGYLSGNAAVNGWGVENVYGLVVETDFTPAEIYVSVFPEGDFYRGLVRFQGLPYFNSKPRFALEEPLLFYLHRVNLRRYVRWSNVAPKRQVEAVVEKAVMRLKEMDTYLKSKGLKHLIFVSPSRNQVFHGEPKDPLGRRMLEKYSIRAVYIVDRLSGAESWEESKVFHDGVHLEKEGHRVWARVIGDELRRVLSAGNIRPGR